MIDARAASWTEIRDRIASGTTVAVLPFGALEQHGPHLPLGTDTLMAESVAFEVAEHLDALLLPPVEYGATWNNAGYPGTVSLSASTVTAIIVDIATALWSFGIRALVIVNGDWGNRAPIERAVAALGETGIEVLALDYPGLDEAGAAVIESPAVAPGLSLAHAGELETSWMLEIAPEHVRMERATVEYPRFPADFGTRPMQLHPFSASGVFGDPRPATADKGRVLLDAVVRASVDAVAEYLRGR